MDLSISSVVSDTGGEGVFVWLDTKRNKVIAATLLLLFRIVVSFYLVQRSFISRTISFCRAS